MRHATLLKCWQLLFAILFISTIVLGIRLSGNIQIDTNLAELSPKNQNSPKTRAAINQLSSSIQKRILLLVSGTNEDEVFEAEQALREGLSKINLLEVQASNDELADNLIAHLKPYRFSLLNTQQRKVLVEQDTTTIATTAQQSLYQLDGQTRVYNFKDDPLGWHSQTILDLFSQNFGLASQGSVEATNNQFALAVSMVIHSGAMTMTTQTALGKQIEQAIAQVRNRHSVDIDRSGVFFFAAQAAKHSKQDISFITTGSSIGVLLLLIFAFRNVRALVLPFASVIIGIGFAFVMCHTLFGKVHILTIVFGASLIGIVIDYSLHFFYHRFYHVTSDQQAIASGSTALHRALLLSLMTSLIGYAALSFSSLDALKKVAIFSCCGLSMAWLSVICLGDFSLKKHHNAPPQFLFARLVNAASSLAQRLTNKVWAGIAVSVIISAILVNMAFEPFDDDPRLFFKAPQALLESEQRVAAKTNDYEPGRYIVVSGINKPQVYDRHQQLFEKINASRVIDPANFTSLLNWVPNQDTQAHDYQLQGQLYEEGGAADLLVEQLGGGDISALKAEYQAASSLRLTPSTITETLGQATPAFWLKAPDLIVNFVLIKKGVNANAIAALTADLDGVEYVNTLERTRTALKDQRESASKLLMLAYSLVALLILVRYRTISSLWLLAVPICSSAMVLVAGFIFGFSLNLFHVMALFLVLGFGMDYTIFAREMGEQRSITLQAILLSAITSLLSFGLLGLSAIPVVASFGVTLLIGNLFNLAGAFVYANANR